MKINSSEQQEAEIVKDIGLSHKNNFFNTNAFLSKIAEKNHEQIEKTQKNLIKAGLRDEDALRKFFTSKLIYCIGFSILFILIFIKNSPDISIFLIIPMAIITGAIVGHLTTDFILSSQSQERQLKIEQGVPDMVDLFVICAESGLDLSRSIRRIAKEMRTSNECIADELSLTAIELEMISDTKQVFENLNNRNDSTQIKTLSKTLSQSIEYGSSLGNSLRDLSIESRQKRMITAETKAAQAPTLLTIPLMFCIMPCLFIIMLGPVLLKVAQSFSS